MASIQTHFLNCFEVSPSFLKGQIKTFNPFERIFKNFFFGEMIIGMDYNKENYDKMVEDYYVYKNQFKKYGLTFNVNEECGENGEEYTYFDKIFFIPEDYRNRNENKVFYEGKDYYLIYTFSIKRTYEEKDNKACFELDIYSDYKNDCRVTKKFELQIITLNEQYQQNIKPGYNDFLYIDTKKLGEISKSLNKEMTKREIINYRRIMEIPFIFNFFKSARNDSTPKPDSNDYDSFRDYYEKILNNTPPVLLDKYDFIEMLNIMYEDQYLSRFMEEYVEDEIYKNLEKNSSEGYIDVEDVENLIKKEKEKEKFSFFNGGFLKQTLMSKEYPFIETKKVIYEICDRDKGYFYRRYLIYDPINNFCSFYPFEDDFDYYIYGLKKDQRRMFK